VIPGLLLLIVGLTLAAAAATVGVAAATVSQLELSRWVSYRLRGAGVSASLLENPGMVLTTANALTTLGVIAAGAAVPAVLLELTPTFLGIFTVAAIVPLFVSAAYVVPRVLGRRWAEQIVAHAVPWMEGLGRVLAPFLPRRDPSTRTTLAAVLSGGGTGALASADELEVVAGVLAFADRSIRDVMTPRTAIVAIPEGTPVGEAAHVFIQSGYSRYPVLRSSLDEIVGVVHSKDLLFLEPDAALPVQPVLSVPATRHAADLLLDMQRSHARLAVVLDEFGGTAGVVSFEDLLNKLVSDLFPTEPPVRTSETPLLELDGGAPIVRLAEAFGRPVETRGAQTVGGLLIQYLGRIPRVGERLALQGLEFDVVAASAVRVDRVVVRAGLVRTQVLDRNEEHREG
jgi:CBS domain containing-hemolysin-like protein